MNNKFKAQTLTYFVFDGTRTDTMHRNLNQDILLPIAQEFGNPFSNISTLFFRPQCVFSYIRYGFIEHESFAPLSKTKKLMMT